jgi:hypothetical protein
MGAAYVGAPGLRDHEIAPSLVATSAKRQGWGSATQAPFCARAGRPRDRTDRASGIQSDATRAIAVARRSAGSCAARPLLGVADCDKHDGRRAPTGDVSMGIVPGASRHDHLPLRYVLAFLAAAASLAPACIDFGAVSGGPPGPAPQGDGGGAPAAPAHGGAFCRSLSPPVRFCEDFDDGPLSESWNTTSINGTLAIDSTVAVSAPNALVIGYNGLTPSDAIDTSLRQRFPLSSPTASPVLELQLRPELADSQQMAAAIIASLDFVDPGNDRYTLQLTLSPNASGLGVRFEEDTGFVDGGQGYVNHPIGDTLPMKAWTDVRIEVRRSDAQDASARVWLGGKLVVDTVLSLPFAPTDLQLDLGSTYVEPRPSLPWSVRVDNVTLDIAQ